MPRFDIVKRSDPKATFRVSAVLGAFDLTLDKAREHFVGEIQIEDGDWNVGLIFGASGTGKSTIAKQLWPDAYIRGFSYDGSKAVVDDMPERSSRRSSRRL